MTDENMWHRRTVHLLVARERERRQGQGPNIPFRGKPLMIETFTRSFLLKISPLLNSTWSGEQSFNIDFSDLNYMNYL